MPNGTSKTTQGNASGATTPPDASDASDDEEDLEEDGEGGTQNPAGDGSDDADNPPAKEAGADDKGKRKKADEGITYTSAQVTELIQRELKRAQKRLTDEAARQKQEAEGKFEDLYRTSQASVKDLESQLEDRDNTIGELRELIADTIAAETSDWDTDLLETDPANDNPDWSIKDRLAWLKRNRKLAKKLGAKGTVHGNGPSPKPARQGGSAPQGGSGGNRQGSTGNGSGGNGSGGNRQGGQGGGTVEDYERQRRQRKPSVI